MFGHAEAVIDGRVATGRIQAGGGTQGLGFDPGRLRDRLRGIGGVADKRQPVVKGLEITALANKLCRLQPLADDHMGHGIDKGHVAAGPQGQVEIRVDVGGAHQVNSSRIDHNQARTLTQAAFQARAEYRMGVGGIGADHQYHVGLFHRIEVLGAGGGTQGLFQAVAGG